MISQLITHFLKNGRDLLKMKMSKSLLILECHLQLIFHNHISTKQRDTVVYKKDKKVNEPEHQELVVVPPGRTSHIVPLSRKTGVPRSCDPDN